MNSRLKESQRKKDKTLLLYLDEACVKWLLTIYRMWAKKEHQPLIPTPGGRKGVKLVSVVEPSSGQVLVDFA